MDFVGKADLFLQECAVRDRSPALRWCHRAKPPTPPLYLLDFSGPALKSPEDREAVWAALHDGTIEVLATDHAPHTLEEKDQPYPQSPSGLPSIEWLLPLMIDAASDGRCTFEQIAAWGAANPAKVWDLKGKGGLKPGLDADFSIVDTESKSKVQDGAQVTVFSQNAAKTASQFLRLFQ